MTVKRPTLNDVWVTFPDSMLTEEDDERDCTVCGEQFENYQKVVFVPSWTTHFGGSPNAIEPAHLHCAVQNDEIDLTGEIPERELALMERGKEN